MHKPARTIPRSSCRRPEALRARTAYLPTILLCVGLLGVAWSTSARGAEPEETALAESASFDADWPGFRGPRGDGAAADAEADWPEAVRFETLWKRPLGSGYSGIAVADGRGYVAYGAGEHDWLLAFDTASGVETWKVRLGELYAGHDGSHDGPIATPLVAGGRVFALGAHGRLLAVDAASGEEVWVRDLTDFGEAPFYGFGSSPQVAGGLLAIGVSAEEGPTVVALDPATGETRWTAGDDQVLYQSPLALEIGGTTQIVISGNHRLFGIDPATGDQLWSWELAEEVRAQGQASSVPLPLGDDRLLVKRDAFGHTAIRISPPEDGGEWTVEELWTNDDLARSYVPPVDHDGTIFGYKGGFLVAVDAESGETVWRSRPPGDGFLTRVGDDLVVITKRGELALADAGTEGWQPQAETALFDAAVWSPVTVADGTIYARSMEHLAAVAVRPREEDAARRAEAWPGSELPDTPFSRFLRGLESVEDRGAEVDAFLAEVESLPLVEGEWVHFLYLGDGEESVGITGDMLGDRVQGEMQRVPGTELFYSSHRLPDDAWISYRFFPGFDAEPVTDPRNPVQAPAENPDDAPASVVVMPALEPPPYLRDAPARRGEVERHEIPIPGAEDGEDEGAEEAEESEDGEDAAAAAGPPQPTHRVVEVYVPAGQSPDAAEGEKLPVVFVFLGDLSRELMEMDQILDHLVGDELPRAYVAYVHRQIGRGYFDVFPGYDAQKDVFFDQVVPYLEARYLFSGERAYVGAGFGAFLAGRMALEEPAAATRVALVQPFWLDRSRQMVMEKAEALAEMLKEESEDADLPAFYLERSHFDLRAEHEGWSAFEQTGLAAASLAEMGFPVRRAETNMGFDWAAWRWRMGHALAFALTGDPLSAGVAAGGSGDAPAGAEEPESGQP